MEDIHQKLEVRFFWKGHVTFVALTVIFSYSEGRDGFVDCTGWRILVWKMDTCWRLICSCWQVFSSWLYFQLYSSSNHIWPAALSLLMKSTQHDSTNIMFHCMDSVFNITCRICVLPKMFGGSKNEFHLIWHRRLYPHVSSVFYIAFRVKNGHLLLDRRTY